MGKWIAGLVSVIIGGVAVYYLTVGMTERTEAIDVKSEGSVLVVKNNTDKILRVRVGYVVREGGSSTYCYPHETRADGEGAEDPKLLPNQERRFPPGRCGDDWNGYHVWVWDGEYSELIYETDG